jgi:hypothetical protein
MPADVEELMTRTNVVRGLSLSFLLAVGVLGVRAAAVGADPYAPMVTLSVTTPDGKAQELSARESEVATLKVGNTEYNFRPTILDAKPWNQVRVTIFKGATAQAPDQVLGEVELKTGAPAVASKTNPVFKIAVPKVTAAPNPAEKK